MDIYDYDEEHLSLAAGNCRYFHFRQQRKPPGINTGVSCTECGSWNGTGCKRQQLDKISAEMHLD